MFSRKTKYFLIIGIISVSLIVGGFSGYFIYQSFKSDAIIIQSPEDFAKYNIPGRGSFEDPYIIANRKIANENVGILISELAGYLVIENCTISNCNIGIQLEDYHGYSRSVSIRNNVIKNIRFKDFSAYGIRIVDSFGITIEKNIIVGKYNPIIGSQGGDFANGIVLENSFNIRVVNNSISKCTNGLVLTYCSYSEILNNNISYSYYSIAGEYYSSYIEVGRNNFYAFYFAVYLFSDCFYWQMHENFFNFTVQDHFFGIELSSYGMFGCGGMRVSGKNHEISRNVFNDCYTASQDQSENSVYYLNDITNTNYYGLVAEGHNVQIYHNNFINNYGIPSQGLDLSTSGNNSWYSHLLNEGNYWSNWNGTGAYPIEGWANNEDKYPLIEPIDINL